MHLTVPCLLLVRFVCASQRVFSVTDDVFAYPQYQIDFSPSYILEDDAAARLRTSRTQAPGDLVEVEDDLTLDDVDYEQMILHSRRYLCSIPHIKPFANTTEEKPSEDEQQKELVRAADRGWQLLHDMEGKQCLYYSTGWWSYAFCYNSYVKQFHSLPPTPGGARTWPPQEDSTTSSYFLGKYDSKLAGANQGGASNKQEVAELQTRADGNYLIQRLDGGTLCDLTGKNRKVEIEFHCHPQTTDRIGWIKETTTCAYLMVIYTPRLCNDVAFQPSRDSMAHTIACREILTISEASQLGSEEQDAVTVEHTDETPIRIGRIELGGMKLVGKDGKKIERGRVVMTAEEKKAEIILMQKDGQIQGLSRTKVKELDLKPEEIEQFKKELQKIAGSNDWKIERLIDDDTGQIILQGIVSNDDEEGEQVHETGSKKRKDKGKDKEAETKDEL